MAFAKKKDAPASDKAIKQAIAKKAPAGERVEVRSVGSIRMLNDAAVVVADGKQQLLKGKKAYIVIEG